ncbi:MAG: tRNA (adenosine(37)-N6)-threonylcarbamoyltransferase complex ATPase subunit type 1 TsaE [Proteobacteria bacterium]|nr:tRNA (adenosine(37)-N6)-threonylcarbamoyltransferase complex ATPase subunit type 1 TsaE [Pseudomonadota bacterium]MBU1709649.1 tRNA (adenosine(37)-N6)-threonylcarbamoyltransferase complex ATPase subunit type 1 TsaE [Pseudomonadota bacterium]
MGNPLKLTLGTLADTLVLGEKLGRQAQAGQVITLGGSLGAGKTTLTQAIAKGLAVPDSFYITSPTFGLLHEYPGRLPFYHMDLYRLSGEEEIEDAGLLDYIYGEGLAVIEWPEKLGRLMPENRMHIQIDFISEFSRKYLLTLHGKGLENLLP